LAHIFATLNQFRKYQLHILIFILTCVALFYRVGEMPLSADEPIRSLIALDMEYNGHYVAPELNGNTYFKKPPLYNWLLLLFFKTFGTHSELIVRLPSLLSILLFGWVIIRVGLTNGLSENASFFSAMAWITGGHLLFYSSLLGHIDVTYSLVSFLGIYSIYYFSKREEFLKMFLFSYLAMAAGFLMKGLPSILFQGLTLLAVLFYQKQWRKLFSMTHLLGALGFVVPMVMYLYAFTRQADLSTFVQTLWSESSSRTVGEKGIWKSIEHLFTFPLQFSVDLFPWSLGFLLFLKKENRHLIWSQPFLRICILIFAVNIPVYWLAPDYRARYVFMLTPFILYPTLTLVMHRFNAQRSRWWNMLLIILAGASIYLVQSRQNVEGIVGITQLIMLLVFISVLWLVAQRTSRQIALVVVLFMLSARILYSAIYLPDRIYYSPYTTEKVQGKEIGDMTKGESLAMYHSNVNLTMLWYIAVGREDLPITQRDDFKLNSFYLVPSEVLSDRSNVRTYYRFRRRYLDKPFELVKFTEYFPDMPKKPTNGK